MPEPEIPAAAVHAAAEVLERQYDSQYDGSHLTWRDFADEAREVLAAALPHLADPTSHAVARGAAMADEVLKRYYGGDHG